jgi:hypothetical protein
MFIVLFDARSPPFKWTPPAVCVNVPVKVNVPLWISMEPVFVVLIWMELLPALVVRLMVPEVVRFWLLP